MSAVLGTGNRKLTYIGIDEEIYRKVSDEFAAAFSAGYGFGYYDYPTGEEIHRTEYTKLGYWHSK